MRRAVVVTTVLLVVVAACGDQDEATPSTMAEPPPVATEVRPETTSADDPTTTATTAGEIEPTTTTTTATTTGQPGPARFSVVAARDGVLGWWDGTSWVQAQSSVPLEGDEPFQVLRVGSEPTTTHAAGIDEGCELVEPSVGVVFDPDPWAGQVFDPFTPSGVAVSASWDASPHPYAPFAATDQYRAIASELLAERGVEDAEPGFAQLFRTDIDADGVDEVFAVAERRSDPSGALNPAPAGDYSVAFVRVVIEEVVHTFVLAEWVVVEQSEEGFIQDLVVSRFDAFLDADDDGVDEIAVRSTYYEGSGVSLYDWRGPDAGFVDVISTGCGA